MDKRVCIQDLHVGDYFRFGSKPHVFFVKEVGPSDVGTRLVYGPIHHPESSYALDMAGTTTVFKTQIIRRV